MTTLGRPKKERNISAGKKVRKALGLWGKVFGRDHESANHVAQWERWREQQLPRSTATIRQDIRQGVPLERLQAYADCFNIPHALFLDDALNEDSSAFQDMVMSCRNDAEKNEENDFFWATPQLKAAYMEFNSTHYLNRLLALMGGVYDCYWLANQDDEVLVRSALYIHGIRQGRLESKAAYNDHGAESHVHSVFYRWNKNLHMASFSDENQAVAYCMFIDPLSFRTIEYEKPFSLQGRCLSDDGMVSFLPATSYLLMNQLNISKEHVQEAYDALVRDVFASPFVHKGDKQFSALKAQALAPGMSQGRV